MGKNRRETTVAVKVEDEDLKQLVALLGQAYSYLSNMPSIGSGGSSPTFSTGAPNSTAPPTPGYGAGGSTASANVAPTTGGINPAALHGGQQGFAPAGSGPVFGPSTPSPFNSGGASLTVMGSLTINVQVLTVSAQSVVIQGFQGGGGGAPSPGPSPSPVQPGGGSGGGGGGGGIFGEGGMMEGLGGMVRGLAGSALVGFGVNTLGVMQNAAYAGNVRWQNEVQQIIGGIPILGGMVNSMLGPMLNRSATRATGSELAARMDVPDNPWYYEDPRYVSQDFYGRGGIHKVRGEDAVGYANELLRRGMRPDISELNAIDDASIAAKRDMVASQLKAVDLTGIGGLFDSMDGRKAGEILLASGDWQGALDSNALTEREKNLLLRSRRRQFESSVFSRDEAAYGGIMADTANFRLTRGNYAGAAAATIAESGFDQMMQSEARQDAALARNRRDAVEPYSDAWKIADAEYMEAQKRVADLQLRGESTRLRGAELFYEGQNRASQGVMSQAQYGLSGLSATGQIYGTEMEGLFRRQRTGMGTRVKTAQDEANFYRRQYGADSQLTIDAETRLSQVQSESAGLPFQQIEQKYGGLSSVAGAAGGAARGAAQIIIVQGGGSGAALNDLLGSVLAARVQAAVANSHLVEDQAHGAGPEIIARDRLAVVQSGLDVAQQQASLATYEPPAPFNTAMRTAQNKLRRMQSSFLEPGNMLDQYQTLMRGAQGKVRAIDAYEKRLQQSGVEITPAMRDRLDAQRQEAQMEAFQYKVGMEDGWIDRLVSWSSGAPSFSARIRPTMGEAAHELEAHQSVEGYRQARQFGFVSSRGYQYERNRGNMTDGVGPLQMFPGDLGVQGAAGRRLPKTIGGASDADIDKLLGIGAGGTSDGGASEGTLQEVVTTLKQIAALLGGGAGSTGSKLSFPGPASYGGLGLGAHTENSGLGPKPGDTRLPR